VVRQYDKFEMEAYVYERYKRQVLEVYHIGSVAPNEYCMATATADP
jgi:hypothetical protein